jgi:hypothetical protein
LSVNHPTLEHRRQAALQVPITEVLDLLGIPLESGTTQQIHCPIHEDRHPSARLYASDNRIYCFTCQQGYDVIDLVQHKLGLTFADAITWLEGAFDLTLHVSGLGVLVETSLRRSRPTDPKTLIEVLDEALLHTRPYWTCAAYTQAAVAIDLMVYQIKEGLLPLPEFYTHATALLRKLHAVRTPVQGLPTPPVGDSRPDCGPDGGQPLEE